jgi:hypothetical protein
MMEKHALRPLVRRMTITHSDFYRTLTVMLTDTGWRREANEVFIPIRGSAGVRIVLGLEQTHRIGPTVILPQLDVRFEFNDLGPAEAQDFMRRFDLYFQRGGG